MITLRRGTITDGPVLASIYIRSRATLTFLPDLHTAAETRRFIENHVLATLSVTVAEEDGVPVGIMAEEPGWVDQLYVDPDHFSNGAGGALLAHAQSHQSYLRLWCFQENHRARRFYARRGFVERERTDGSNNMEGCPDILFAWRATRA